MCEGPKFSAGLNSLHYQPYIDSFCFMGKLIERTLLICLAVESGFEIALNELYNHFFFVHPFPFIAVMLSLCYLFSSQLMFSKSRTMGLMIQNKRQMAIIFMEWVSWTGCFFFNSPTQTLAIQCLCFSFLRLNMNLCNIKERFVIISTLMLILCYCRELGDNPVIGPSRMFASESARTGGKFYACMYFLASIFVYLEAENSEDLTHVIEENRKNVTERRKTIIDKRARECLLGLWVCGFLLFGEVRPWIALNLMDLTWWRSSKLVAVTTLLLGISYLFLRNSRFGCNGGLKQYEVYLAGKLLVVMLYDSSVNELNLSFIECGTLAGIVGLTAMRELSDNLPRTLASTKTANRVCKSRLLILAVLFCMIIGGTAIRFKIHSINSYLSISYSDWSPWEKDDTSNPPPREPTAALLSDSWGAVVANSFLNDTDWLFNRAERWSKNNYLQLVVYDRLERGAMHYAPNVGREAAPMALFVYQYYHSLPEWTFFIHGHRLARHQNFDMRKFLEGAKQMFEENEDTVVYQLVSERLRADRGWKMEDWDSGQKIVAYKAWEVLFPMQERPKVLEACLYAQFAVHRSVLHRRSREEWGFLYRFFVSAPIAVWPFKDWHVGYIGELLWLQWFNEPLDRVLMVPT